MTINSRQLALVADLGGTHVRVALSDCGQLHARQIENTVQEGAGAVVQQIARMAQHCITSCEPRTPDVLVIACPGPLDVVTGIVYQPPNMVGWGDVPLGSLLEQALGLEIVLVNDANAAAYGEWTHGAGVGTRWFVYITVSTGIGAGLVFDGHLLTGVRGVAGELGHICIDPNGPICGCGNRGCLEALASGTAIARRYNELAGSVREQIAHSDTGPGPATAADVAAAAAAGEPLSSRVFDEAATALGIGVANIVQLCNPEVVVLGGGVSLAGAMLFERVRRVVDANVIAIAAESVKIVPAALGDHAGLMGCAALASVAPA